ncbi:MAG: hypothetical protein JWM93_2702 [Frankiales bacterium]|nr:hypothetical protein [Frankiales bacterium]
MQHHYSYPTVTEVRRRSPESVMPPQKQPQQPAKSAPARGGQAAPLSPGEVFRPDGTKE